MAETVSAWAAFDVFAKRERAGVLTLAIVGCVLLCIALFAAFAALGAAQVQAFAAAYLPIAQAVAAGEQISDPGDPRMAALMQAGLAVVPGYLLFLLTLTVVLSALEAAVLRWLVRGEAGGGFLGLNLGADTWRALLCRIVWMFLLFGLVAAAAIGQLTVSGLGVVASAAQGGSVGPIVPFVSLIANLVILGALIYICVRLSPATATVIGRKKFAFFDAWKVTRGRFWALFFAYLILVVLYLLAVIVISTVMAMSVMGPMFSMIAEGAPPTPEQTNALLMQPQNLAILVVCYCLILVVVVTFFLASSAVQARAVRVALAEGRIAPPA